MENAMNLAQEAFEDAVQGHLSEEDAIEAVTEVAEASGYENEELESIFQELGIRISSSRMRKSSRTMTAGVVDWALRHFGKDRAMLKAIVALILVSGNSLLGYTVKEGDTIWKIANGDPKKTQQILELNGLGADEVIRPGQEIVLPEEVAKKTNTSDNEKKTDDKNAEEGKFHVVEKGDTLSAIANRYKVGLKEIKEANPEIKDFDRLSIGQKIALPKNSIDPKADFVARVIYAETSTKCSSEEVGLVARVIYNRIGDRRFGGGTDAYSVVRAKNAFSCASGKDGNKNWSEYSKDLNDATRKAYEIAEGLMNGETSKIASDSEIVYYCNKSMAMANADDGSTEIDGQKYGYPKGWESSSWKPVPVKVTDHFVFYKIEKK